MILQLVHGIAHLDRDSQDVAVCRGCIAVQGNADQDSYESATIQCRHHSVSDVLMCFDTPYQPLWYSLYYLRKMSILLRISQI